MKVIKGKFKKGQSGNPKCRPKGALNKATGDLKEWIDELIRDNRQQFTGDLMKVEPNQRLQILERMMTYVIPKQQSISVEAQIQAEYAALEGLLNK